MSDTTYTPGVSWAQRSSDSDPEKNYIYLTIVVPDVPAESLKLDVKDQSLTFSGTSTTLKRDYHLSLELYGVVDPEQTKILHTGKQIEVKLQKKELTEEFWPRLTKEKLKAHYLKTDFDRWVDEDEQEEAAEEDFSKFGGMPGGGGMEGMGGMGGMPGMEGMGGLGGMGGMPGMGGADFGNLDFSKLGGAGGFPGAGGEDDDEDDDDDDMPALEGEEEAKAAPAKSS